MSQTREELEDWLLELKVSPAVLTLAALLKTCEHRQLHKVGRFLDLPEAGSQAAAVLGLR